MKKIGIIFFIVLVLMGCEQDFPYPGYLHVEPLFVESDGGIATVPIETDHGSITLSISEEDAEWCNYTTNGSTVNLQVSSNSGGARSAVIVVRAGHIERNLTVYQWGQQGENKVRLINNGWTATCSDEQTSDGGGVYSIFTDDQSGKYWHSAWSPSAPLPHWIIVDMKNIVPVSELYLGWRNNNYHTDTRAFTISVSTDGENYTEVADVDRGASPEKGGDLPHTIVTFPLVDARYIKMYIYESNRNPNCNLASFIPYASK